MSTPAPNGQGRAPVRRRGHQHHLRLRGDRRPAAALAPTDPSKEVPLTHNVVPSIVSVSESVVRTNSDNQLSSQSIQQDLVQSDEKFESKTQIVRNESLECIKSDEDFSYKDKEITGDGAESKLNTIIPNVSEEDPETAELAKLRCASECTEVLAERENSRRRRCADYPGLAFGRSIFSSDTMMKFSLIKNELQNIKNTALKRAETEVAALTNRIQLLEGDLQKLEEGFTAATAELNEASQAANESEEICKELENRANMEDNRVAILESQLAHAKVIAQDSDKKYEELARKLVLIEEDLKKEIKILGDDKILERE